MSLSGKPALATAAPVENDGFWPDLSLSEFMAKYRIPAEYADDVISNSLVVAMVEVNDSLQDVKARIKSLGFIAFEGYAINLGDTINIEELLMHRYKRAVFCYAKADLLPQFNSMNRKPEAENQAKEAPETRQHWLNESQKCVSAIFRAALPGVDISSSASVHVGLI